MRTVNLGAVLLAVVVLAAACSTDRAAVPPFDDATTTTTTTTTTGAPAASTTTTVPIETVEEFLDGFIGAYRTGNPVFLIQRIHPDLREFYGDEACRAEYEDFVPDDTATVTIRTVSSPASWSESFDGVMFTFEDVYIVDAGFVDFGQTRRQDFRLARVGNRFYFFQDCGDPVVVTTTTIDPNLLSIDENGFYYVHRGPGDSEDFVVPGMFRITYTGTASTCSFQLVDAETGTEVRYVTGLEGGGIRRMVMSEPLTTVYITDVLGCSRGELQVGPNP